MLLTNSYEMRLITSDITSSHESTLGLTDVGTGMLGQDAKQRTQVHPPLTFRYTMSSGYRMDKMRLLMDDLLHLLLLFVVMKTDQI